jgi:hypothetical protein
MKCPSQKEKNNHALQCFHRNSAIDTLLPDYRLFENKVVGSPWKLARSHADCSFYSTNKERKQEFFAPKIRLFSKVA